MPHVVEVNKTLVIVFQNQWEDQGGKCGVCGDPWQGPRDYEPGGKMYNGMVTDNYVAGNQLMVG